MSVCAMSIEAGACAGMTTQDVTFNYLPNRPLSLQGDEWDHSVTYWRSLETDKGAKFDIRVNIPTSDIIPTVTWGTSPQDVVANTDSVPDPSKMSDSVKRASVEHSLGYMGLMANASMEEIKIYKVFVGSCTNKSSICRQNRTCCWA